jgi:hypothetical protein
MLKLTYCAGIHNSSCVVKKGLEAEREHEEEHLQLEPPRRHRVDRLRQEPLESAEARLDHLPVALLQIFHPRWKLASRVPLPLRQEFDLACLGQQVLGEVFVVRLVAVDHGAGWEVEREVLQFGRVAARARREVRLDREPVLVDEGVDLHPVEEPAFTARIAPKGAPGLLQRVELRTLDACVVTARQDRARSVGRSL